LGTRHRAAGGPVGGRPTQWLWWFRGDGSHLPGCGRISAPLLDGKPPQEPACLLFTGRRDGMRAARRVWAFLTRPEVYWRLFRCSWPCSSGCLQPGDGSLGEAERTGEPSGGSAEPPRGPGAGGAARVSQSADSGAYSPFEQRGGPLFLLPSTSLEHRRAPKRIMLRSQPRWVFRSWSHAPAG